VADEHGVVGLGADLEPGTLLAAYRHGMFPMPLHQRGPMAWWSPDPRGVLPLDGLRVSRSLRRSCDRYEVRIDTDFASVVAGCADPHRAGGWINRDISRAYTRLHELGWAHSVEAWDDDGLAGGLYGVAVDGLFAGESMFHRRPDASKVALVALVELLRADGRPARLLDVQWATDHLRSLGAVELPRPVYLSRLAEACRLPLPPAFS
jgi:leucyl/phenylalanyl-tRNA--protein transferase